MTSLLLFFSGLALGAVYARLLPVLRAPRPASDLITDGFGNYWPRRCWCGGEYEIVRPGFVQCSREGQHSAYYDKFENWDATHWDTPNVLYTETGYHPGEYNYHPEGQGDSRLSGNGNGEMPGWY